MSIRVRMGVVAAIRSRSTTWSGGRWERRWMTMPGLRRLMFSGTEISTGPFVGGSRRQNTAALRWAKAAHGPHAKIAAIHLPYRSSCGRPTAYTPRCTRCSRPFSIRLWIAEDVRPNPSSCGRVTTPCCRSHRDQRVRDRSLAGATLPRRKAPPAPILPWMTYPSPPGVTGGRPVTLPRSCWLPRSEALPGPPASV